MTEASAPFYRPDPSRRQGRFLCFIVVVLLSVGAFNQESASGSTFAPTADEVKKKPAQFRTDLSRLPLKVAEGRTFVEVADMRILVGEGLDSAFAGNRWTNGIVYYVFDPAVASFNRQRWRAAAAEWSAVAALTFVENTGNGNYIYVRNSSVNQSWLGMIGGRQEMEITSWPFKFIIAHEIGHALGLDHEHVRSDRNSYVTILWNNIQNGNDFAFQLQSTANYGAYDFDSAMHYDKCAFSNDCPEGFSCQCSNYTISVRPPYNAQWQDRIGQIDHLSQLDGFGMAQRYGSSVGTVRGDFNGDASTDYLLFNSGTRDTLVWHLQGNTYSGGVVGPTLPGGWVVACVADFNLDGNPDYALFQPSTRQTVVWHLDHATFLRSAYGPTLPAGWSLIAAIDINKNGNPDYVLFHPGIRRTAIWYLNGTRFAAAAYGPTLSPGWTLVDAIDFNANNRPDLLLFNPGTRQTAIWYLNGATHAGSAFGPTISSGWTLLGTADFNANAKPDYVLFQPSTRRTAIWYLNGGTLTGSAFGPTLPTGYSLVFP